MRQSDQYNYHYPRSDEIDKTSETNTDDDDTEDEDDNDQSSKAQNWHQRLLKSASGVFQRGSSSPETRQCVNSTNFSPSSLLGYYFLEAEAEDANNSWASPASAPISCAASVADLEVKDLVTSNLTSVSKNNNNKNNYYYVWFISPQIIIALSILLILHVVVMANF